MVNFSSVITAVITTSPLYIHPSTEIIDVAYDSIQSHLPGIPVLILADGVRAEQRCWAERYEHYLQNLQHKGWPNVRVLSFETFHHQAGMIRAALPQVRTPLILWVEHDLPLLKRSIDWQAVSQLLLDGTVHSVRFLMDDVKKPYYERGEITNYGLSLTKTVEFSSLPNISRKDLYEFIVPHFKHAQIHLECNNTQGLFHEDDCKNWILTLYNPPDGLPRCGSTGGRSAGLTRPDGPKLPMRF